MSLLKRPLFAVGVAGFCALIAAALLSFWAAVAVAGLCLFAGVLALVRRRAQRTAVCLLSAAVALSLFLLWEMTLVLPLGRFSQQSVRAYGTVVETNGISNGVLSVVVRVADGDLPRGTRVLLRAPFSDLAPIYGDEVKTVFTAELPVSRGFFDRNRANRIFLNGWTGSHGEFTLYRREERSFAKTVFSAKTAIANELLFGFPREVRPLLSAMCLGDKSLLSDDTATAFRRAGVSHLLVVSGLHMSIVAMGFYGLLRRLRAPRRAACAAALAVLWAFAVLVGFHPSVVRACVLNTLVLSGGLFRRRADGLNSLGGGLLLLWAVNPFCVYDVGLWLSFGATFGLLGLLPRLTRTTESFLKNHSLGIGERPMRFVLASFNVTLAATVPILPICALVFGEISVIAPIANLLCVFPATLLLWCAAGGLLFQSLSLGFVAGGLRLLATGLARFLLWATSLCGGASWAVFLTDEPYRRWWVIGATVLVVALWKYCGKKTACCALLAAVAVLFGLCAGDRVLSRGKTEVTVRRAYGDNAVLLERDGARCLLVDGGNGWTAAKSLLQDQNATNAQTVMVLDPKRKLGRRFSEFCDRVTVEQYVLTAYEKKAVATLKEQGELEIDTRARVFKNAVTVLYKDDTVVIQTASGAAFTVDLTETSEVAVRLK